MNESFFADQTEIINEDMIQVLTSRFLNIGKIFKYYNRLVKGVYRQFQQFGFQLQKSVDSLDKTIKSSLFQSQNSSNYMEQHRNFFVEVGDDMSKIFEGVHEDLNNNIEEIQNFFDVNKAKIFKPIQKAYKKYCNLTNKYKKLKHKYENCC